MPKTVEELEADVSSLTQTLNATRGDLGTTQETVKELRGKLKEVNDEAKGHRLNADNFRRSTEELKTQLEEANAGKLTLAEQHRVALEAIRSEHGTALETLRSELTGKLSTAETELKEVGTKAAERVLNADLRLAAQSAGMVDLDGLKLLDQGKVELDDAGNLKNGADLMAALKEAKPFLFTKPGEPPPPPNNSGNPQNPPPPKTPTTKKATDMTAEEYAAARQQLMATGLVPT